MNANFVFVFLHVETGRREERTHAVEGEDDVDRWKLRGAGCYERWGREERERN